MDKFFEDKQVIDWIIFEKPVYYSTTLEIMESKLQQIIEGKSPETVFLLEHEDVYTAGTNHDKKELLEKTSDIPVIYTGRGGKYTYHGPGQAIIYPLIDLRKENRKQDIRLYIKNLEFAAINTLKKFDLNAYTIDNKVGIWIDYNNLPAKIGLGAICCIGFSANDAFDKA